MMIIKCKKQKLPALLSGAVTHTVAPSLSLRDILAGVSGRLNMNKIFKFVLIFSYY